MSIKLYGYWRSSAAYRVRIALSLKGLEYENIPVSLMPGISEHRQEAYCAKNPQMLVPFMEDGDIALNQSMAILEYLEETYPDVALLPSSEPMRSEVRAFCNVIACDIHPLQNLRVMRYVGAQYDGDAKKWSAHWMREGFKALEAVASEGGPYVFGDSVTLADALLVPQIYNARRFEMPTDDFPKLIAAVDNANELEAFKIAAPEAQPDAT
jgi:maleylacetoacetate isomerase/maleylpyruvate isomerase